MQLKQAIEQINGLGFIAESLNILSSVGKRCLLSLPFLTKQEEIEKILNETETVWQCVNNKKNEHTLSLIAMKIMQLRDIYGTIRNLTNKNVLNDIELFEIKHFAILSEYIREQTRHLNMSFIEIPNLRKVISLLDPEQKHIPHFYIYDSYSYELAAIRAELRSLTQQGADENRVEEVRFEAEIIEDKIRRELSEKLLPHASTIKKALDETARLDLLLAKAQQAIEMKFYKPTLATHASDFTGIFHPEIRDALRRQNKEFQPIDIIIPLHPTVITGANMAGKSVLLKSIALAQTMMQFGFFVPAEAAAIVPVEKIIVCAGDAEDNLAGLSSFAAEMLRLNEMMDDVRNNTKLLVLIDELARTTNPVEGEAIVCGMLDFLIQHNIQSLITTHYGINMPCRKLRVKGFTENKNNEKVTIENINNYINYSLEETTKSEVPHEALRIAQIIGVNKEILNRANKYLNKR